MTPARSAEGCSPRWKVSPSPRVKGSGLNDISATSSTDIWAVGGDDSGTLIEHWDGSRWRIVPSPNVDFLTAVAATSASNAWAVGQAIGTRMPQAPILHWNGRRWSEAREPPKQAIDLWDLAAAGADRAWAVGTGLIESWNGRRWHVVPGAADLGGGELNGVAAPDPTRAWAVGESEYGKTLVERWGGKRWRFVPSPNVALGDGPDVENSLDAIDAASPTDAWAIGHWQNAPEGKYGVLIEHWDGRRWRTVRSPAGYLDLAGVSAIAADDVWAVGARLERSNVPGLIPGHALVEHWDGQSWRIVRGPSTMGLNDVAAISRTNVWVVGGDAGYPGFPAFIVHFGCA